MKNFTFEVPTTFNHLFVEVTDNSPHYYLDANLKNRLFPTSSKTKNISTLLPDNLFRVEMSKISTDFNNIADTINYFHLWPFSHMCKAEVIVDSSASESFHLFNDNAKEFFRERMENINWVNSLFIVYTKKDGTKIGFLLFR